MPMYLGEASGARILQYGIGLVSIDTNHQGEFTIWPFSPSGEMGDNVFRSVGVSFVVTNGWSLGVTVYVDGQSLGEKTFGGVGATENGQAQVFVKRRGNQIAVRARTLSRSGQIAFTNVQISYVPLRVFP